MSHSKAILLIVAIAVVAMIGGLVALSRFGGDSAAVSAPVTKPDKPRESAVIQPLGTPSAPRISSNSKDLKKPRPAAAEKAAVPKTFALAPLALNLQGPAFERQPDGRILKKDVAKLAEDLNAPDQDPVEDVQILSSMVGAYHRIFRENPIAGENREVVEALTGKNPYQLLLIDPSHPAINESGELVDRWNVPFRFHPISRDHMEILSAGEDQQFGTGDDIMLDEPVTFGNFDSAQGEG